MGFPIREHYWTIESLRSDVDDWEWEEHPNLENKPYRYLSHTQAKERAERLALETCKTSYKAFRVVEIQVVTTITDHELFQTQTL